MVWVAEDGKGGAEWEESWGRSVKICAVWGVLRAVCFVVRGMGGVMQVTVMLRRVVWSRV